MNFVDKPLSYGRQWIDEEDIAAVVRILRSDWLTQGPAVEAFESALAQYCKAKHAVVATNGTVALHLACLAARIGPGDEGITSPITFLASANCLIYCGARPVFADIDPSSWNIDSEEIVRNITPKTRILIPVHFAGLPCDMEAISRLAKKHDLLVIEDACHALGATYNNFSIGSGEYSDMTVLSFHPVKHITTGEGGAILTNNDELAHRLRMLRHHGIVKEGGEREGPWWHTTKEIGLNARLTDIQCALGLSQLCKLDDFLRRRREIASRYRVAFDGLQGVRCQITPTFNEHAYHLFVIHLDPRIYNRRLAFEALRERGISPQVHYIPVHTQPAMRKIAGEFRLPRAEEYYEGCLSLPMFPAMTESDVDRVINAVSEIVKAQLR